MVRPAHRGFRVRPGPLRQRAPDAWMRSGTPLELTIVLATECKLSTPPWPAGEDAAAFVHIGIAAAVAASRASSGKCGDGVIGMGEPRTDGGADWFRLAVAEERDRGPRPAPGQRKLQRFAGRRRASSVASRCVFAGQAGGTRSLNIDLVSCGGSARRRLRATQRPVRSRRRVPSVAARNRSNGACRRPSKSRNGERKLTGD